MFSRLSLIRSMLKQYNTTQCPAPYNTIQLNVQPSLAHQIHAETIQYNTTQCPAPYNTIQLNVQPSLAHQIHAETIHTTQCPAPYNTIQLNVQPSLAHQIHAETIQYNSMSSSVQFNTTQFSCLSLIRSMLKQYNTTQCSTPSNVPKCTGI